MTRKINTIGAFLVLFGLLSISAAAKCSDSDTAALKKFDLDWGAAVEARDRAALEKIYSDSYAGFGLNAITDKKTSIENAMTGPQGTDQPKVTYDHYIISCTASSAVITHRVVVHAKEGENYARSVHFLEKNGGSWQVVGNAGSPMDDAGSLIYQEISGYKAYMARDEKWFEKHTDEHYTGVSLSGQVMDKKAFIKSMKADNNKYESVKLSDVQVNVEGKTAIVTGVFTVTGQSADGVPIDMKFRFTRTMVKNHGRWMALASHNSAVTEN